jgi:hypothetical protein
VLFVDVDGVISLFPAVPSERPERPWLNVDGILHVLSTEAGGHLRDLATDFELVWCTGWEEKANEHLPRALGLDGPLPYLDLDRDRTPGHRQWKLGPIERFAGDRPLAWIDDDHDAECRDWARGRKSATLLVTTRPDLGITSDHVHTLLAWARGLESPGEG